MIGGGVNPEITAISVGQELRREDPVEYLKALSPPALDVFDWEILPITAIYFV